MAARKRKITLSDDWRERIKIGEIMNRLTRHVNGKCDMSTTQISAAKLLLSKVAPDLRSIEHYGEVGHRHSVINANPEISVDEWQKQLTMSSGNPKPDPKPH